MQQRNRTRLAVIVEPSFFEWQGWRKFGELVVVSGLVGGLAFVAGLWAGR